MEFLRYIVFLISSLLFFNFGCSHNRLPNLGPNKSVIKSQSNHLKGLKIHFVKINSSNCMNLGRVRVPSIYPKFKEAFIGRKIQILGVGDQLNISIWEASGDGLFSTTEKKQTDIDVVIDEKGFIFIPYVGNLKVEGKPIEAVRKEISKGLSGIAIEPQVQVKLNNNISNNVVVIGAINQPDVYPIPVGGIKILELLSRAGGSQLQAFETRISLLRGDLKGDIQLDAILDNSSNNVWLQAGDTLQVIKSPKVFTALGAVKAQKKYQFENRELSLSEAIAQAGGLIETVSDSSGVFLFRFEKAGFLKMNGLSDLDRISTYAKVPVIYQLDLSKAESFFLASQFMMQDDDLIYVSTAPSREYNKFLDTFVKPLLDLGRTGIVISNENNN